MINFQTLMYHSLKILPPLALVGGVVYVLSLPRIKFEFRRGDPRHLIDFRMTQSRLTSAAQSLSDAFKRDGRFPAPLPWQQNEAYALADQTVLPEVGSDLCWLDPVAHRETPFRYATEGAHWIIVGAGPNRKWDFDVRDWKPGMAMGAAALSNLTYDPTNGVRSGGDVFRLGGAP